ncbi:MAG: hypothetical protein OXI81_02315 [Paracoccaceae bacterium]|nr:hypothetical protein [Paracoccaceae bacterium]
MQPFVVDVPAAIEHAQHLHGVVGLHPTGVLGQPLETLLDVAAFDGGRRRDSPVLESLAQGGHDPA